MTTKTITFAPQTTFTVGDNPYSVASGDFNSDGIADVVTANLYDNNVSLLLGDGYGGFNTQTTFAVGNWPDSVNTADFNRDGNLDLATSNWNDNTVSVLLGNGYGSFGVQTTFFVGTKPWPVSVGDFNRDGIVDLATANSGSTNVSVLFGGGYGDFGIQNNFAVGASYAVHVGDFNGDKYPDLVAANYSSNDISILLNDGYGSFSTQTTFAVGASPYSVDVGDFNGDGNTDVVTANMGGANVSVLLGDGRGSFGTQTTFAVGTSPWSVSVGDFNADGFSDLASANNGSNNISVLLGDGRGSFGSQTIFEVGLAPISINVGDFNKDGKTDLVTANNDSDDISVLLNTTVSEAPVATQHPHTGSITINGNLIEGEELHIENTLKDADGLGAFSYQWLSNGKAISGAVYETYTLTAGDVGKAIKVKVSYIDGLKKVENETSAATDLIEAKQEIIHTPTYALSIDKTSANEGSTVTFKLTTENVEEGTEIPVVFSGTISNADVLGGLSTNNSFVIEANGKASLAVKFLEDKLTEGAENLTVTLNDDTHQTATVNVKDTSISPNSPSGITKIDGLTLTAKSNAKALLIGTGKNDSLTGLAGADTLRGDAGSDVLDGGLGNDSLEGGNGNDTLIGGDGNDKLNGGSGDDKLDGGKGSDKLDGGQGKDILNGGAGVDTMTGGDGDDNYFVENAKDVVIETNKNVTEGGKDTITSTSNYTLGEFVENLILDDAQGKGNSGTGNKSANTITGSIGDNKLYGMAGNDTLDAGDGADTLDGGLGMDSLIGGNGSDVYYMNNDGDIIEEKEDGGEQDQIIASVSFNLSQSENVEVLTLSGAKAQEGTGNALNNLLQEIASGKTNNTFSGNEGNDTINGQGGNDTLDGGDGDDELDGGLGDDVAIFSGIYTDYLITTNFDAEGVAQLIVEYSNFQNTGILDGTDILNNIEILEFADGDRHNRAEILQDIAESEMNANAMILTGVENV